ncbi:MAG: hypothetical protein KJ621_21165 [Proteobacteria bacterium]|nr:hypothetical protein [Pseudomonadota bacterium]
MDIKGFGRIELIDDKGKIKETRELANLVVNTGENYLAGFLANATPINFPMTFLAVGTGIASPAETDTALGAEIGTRVNGTKSNPSANIYRVVGTFAAGNGTGALAELGIFHQVTPTGSIMLNRLQFAVINKGASDSIQITLDITIE